jgi:hypothetical protein
LDRGTEARGIEKVGKIFVYAIPVPLVARAMLNMALQQMKEKAPVNTVEIIEGNSKITKVAQKAV